MSEELLLELDLGAGIRQLTLNRPEQRNALDSEQWERLTAALRALAAVGDVSCLILTGSGTAFASGGDISRFLEEVREPNGPKRFRQRIRECLDALYDFPAPTLAKVNGAAIGGGMELALACDVRVASETAKFSIPAARFGMVMALPDFARLAASVGIDRARFLTMTGAVIDAAQALSMGLVQQAIEPERLDEAALKLARMLASAEREAALWFRQAAKLMTQPDAQQSERLRAFEEACLAGLEFQTRVRHVLSRS